MYKNTIHWTLLVCLLLSAVPTMAQRRLASDDPTTEKLTRSDSHDFTKKDKRPSRDGEGLMSSDYFNSQHVFGLWINGAYSTILHHIDGVSVTPGGYDGGLGVLYEFRQNYFMMQVGVGTHFQGITCYRDDIHFTNWNLATDMWDKDARFFPLNHGGQLRDNDVQGVSMSIDTLHYYISGRKDIARTLYLEVPILFGGHYGGFYGLGGVKLNMALWGNTHTKQNVTTKAQYNDFIGDMYEMDNHGYRNLVEISHKGGRVPFKFDILLSAELGYEFHNDNIRYRLAAYADYGLLNINPKCTEQPFYFPFEQKWNFDQFRMQHLYASSITQNSQLHNLFAGIKFTILFDTPKQDKCILCEQAKKNKRR